MSALFPAPGDFTGKWSYILRCERRMPEMAVRKTGVDRIIAPDYMGAAEFEFGAIPHSIRQYREQGVAGNMATHRSRKIKLQNGKPISILCHASYDLDQVEDTILRSHQRGFYTKEPTYFERHLPGGDRRILDTTCFWMVMNGHSRFDFVMWSIHQVMIDEMYTELKKVLPTPEGVPSPSLRVDPLVVQDGSELSIFDTVTVQHKNYNGIAQIVGIYDTTCDVKLPDSSKLKGIKYSHIKRIKS